MLAGYSELLHAHHLAAWAAFRAAFRGTPITLAALKSALDTAEFGLPVASLDHLPAPDEMDAVHFIWREDLITKVKSCGVAISHGRAAKIINVYHKIRFQCSGAISDDRVRALHPPIDRVLLSSLKAANFGGKKDKWRDFEKAAWSKYDSDTYQAVINHIREACRPKPMWKIEAFWQGYQ